jgi:hypothetical protein
MKTEAAVVTPQIENFVRPIVFLALALLTTALTTPSLAVDYSDPRAVVEALYAGYQPPNAFPDDRGALQSTRLNSLFEADAKEADGEMGRIDFDPFINGQDYDVTKVEISEPSYAAGKALVRVNVVNFGQPDEFGVLLVKEADGWKVDDVWNDGDEFSYDLLDILQAPLP